MCDVAYQTPGFIYRVAGICVHEGHVLLHRGEFENFWGFPGGRPELMETSMATLGREMQEEIGAKVEVGRLRWVMEHFFAHAGRNFHELGFYYEMRLPADSPHLDVRREFIGTEGPPTLIFRWFPIDGLKDVRLYPSFFRTALANLPASPQHVVSVGPDDASVGNA